MSQHLMHVEYHPTNVCLPASTYEEAADWLNEKIRADGALSDAERNEPEQVNLLANLVADDEPPMAVDPEAARRFGEIVERAVSTEDAETEIADITRTIADHVVELAEHHHPLMLELV